MCHLLFLKINPITQHGLTFIEQIIVVLFVSIISLLSYPSLKSVHDRNKKLVIEESLIRNINLARESAITLRTKVTICGKSSTSNKCSREWSKGVYIFVEKSTVGQINREDKLILSTPPLSDGTIIWRTFQNKSYIQFLPTGMTNYQNGNVTYCPKSKDVNHAGQLIINAAGRIRVAHDSDKDSIPNNAKGENISC